MITRLCIFGVGLIGGSLALALRRAGLCESVIGCSRDEANLQAAQALGVIDEYSLDPVQAVAGADMILLATPLGAMTSVLSSIKDRMPAQAVLTDVGSAKACVVEAVRTVFGRVPGYFVPGHPIAGTEQSGVQAAFADLYCGRRVVLTPLQETDADALERVRAMWQAAGAEVEEMAVDMHDTVLAATSHLPHMAAFALVDSLARMGDHEAIFRYAAGGFRDFTRIASSDPIMWRDICLSNRSALMAMLARYRADLADIEQAIEQGDGDSLLAIFSRAKQARDTFCG